MQLERHARGAIDVLEVSGPWRSTVLRRAIRELTQIGEPIVVLDLRGVDALSSACLGGLVASRDRIGRAGGLLKLAVTTAQRRRLRQTGLAGLFELFPDAEQAIDSFEAETMTFGVP
jgi:anti-anti-sigma factor